VQKKGHATRRGVTDICQEEMPDQAPWKRHCPLPVMELKVRVVASGTKGRDHPKFNYEHEMSSSIRYNEINSLVDFL